MYGMRGFGRMGTMGTTCPPGYYDLQVLGVNTGQCLPTLNTAATAAETAVSAATGAGIAQSAATQSALQNAAASAFGTKVLNFYKAQPVLAWGLTAGVAAFVVYGGLSFIRGR
jgi:hypothetical protein